ncbi:hypothetical protein [Wenyingzhuangia sp. IMCC45574]
MNNLEILLLEYEKKCTVIESELNESIKENDFLTADSLQKILVYNKQKLRTLKNLKNPAYSKIESLEFWNNNLRRINTESEEFPPYNFESNLKEIALNESKIKELKKIKSENDDSDELLNFIHQIIEKQIRQFSIQIENEFETKVLRKKSSLNIEIKRLDNFSLKGTIREETYKELETLEFKLENENLAIKKIEMKEVNALKILELISCVNYDIFQCYGEKTATIRIT